MKWAAYVNDRFASQRLIMRDARRMLRSFSRRSRRTMRNTFNDAIVDELYTRPRISNGSTESKSIANHVLHIHIHESDMGCASA